MTSPYPPSFDNNPLIFGWALFARMLVCSLSCATLLRLRSRNARECLPANHPVFIHRTVIIALLWALVLGSSSDVLTYLFWGEATVRVTEVVLLLSRLLDALTMMPFLIALFVRLWINWLCRMGVLGKADAITLNGIIHDMRAIWTSPEIPMRIFSACALGSGLVTVGKYVLWMEHARP